MIKKKTHIVRFILIYFLLFNNTGQLLMPENSNNKRNTLSVNAQTKVLDIINHPLFEGFGQFIFPVEHGLPSASVTISNINSLLPYHSYINSKTTIDTVNYILDVRANSKKIFYDIYSDEEKNKFPAKVKTGLFFFKGKPGAPFAIISAGGGFSYVGSIHESFPHALELSKQGYNAFSLQYRTGGEKVACEDLATAISFIFKNAELFEVNVKNYSLWGGSAGARMAANLGSYGPSAFGGANLPRPIAVIMQYTGHTDYTANDPATFVVVGEDDGIASWKTMKQRIDNLNKLGIETEFRKYKNLGHGFGLGIATTAEGWIDLAVSFWKRQIDKK
jgi:predicted esterase